MSTKTNKAPNDTILIYQSIKMEWRRCLNINIHIILFEYMEIHPMTKRSTFLISPGVIMIVRIAILFYFCWILSFDASECEA